MAQKNFMRFSYTETTKILHDVLPGELDVSGTWIMQAEVTAVTWTGKGRPASFRVKRCLQP